MNVRGFTRDELDGSFVYFIFSQNLLYIGETQKVTFTRWVQHFYKSGTFSKKVRKYGVSGVDYFDRVNLISVELEEIRNTYLEARWKTITQAVEHILHIELLRSQTRFKEAYYDVYQPDVSRYRVVSDTSKTAPKSISASDWDFAETLAEQVIDETCDYLGGA